MSKREKVIKALADENRLSILDLLKDGELCAAAILENLGIGQSTLSHHMKILCESEVVVSRKKSRWVYYKINDEIIDKLIGLLNVYKNT